MKRVKIAVAAWMLGAVLLFSFGETMPVYGMAPTEPISACGVPLPDSLPGEEKKDMLSALIGFSVLTAVVIGGLLFLRNNHQNKEN